MATWIQFAALSPSLHLQGGKKKRAREGKKGKKRKWSRRKEEEKSWKRKIQFTRNRVTAFGSINFSFLLLSLLSPPHQRDDDIIVLCFSFSLVHTYREDFAGSPLKSASQKQPNISGCATVLYFAIKQEEIDIWSAIVWNISFHRNELILKTDLIAGRFLHKYRNLVFNRGEYPNIIFCIFISYA